MAKSKETFNKKEKEKKRLKQRQEKREKMEERKANAKKGQSLDDMMAYIDEDGNISSTPPDPKKKKLFNVEDIQIGVPKFEETDEDLFHDNCISALRFFNFVLHPLNARGGRTQVGGTTKIQVGTGRSRQRGPALRRWIRTTQTDRKDSCLLPKLGGASWAGYRY